MGSGEDADDGVLGVITMSGVSRSLDRLVSEVTETSELILVLESGLSSFIFKLLKDEEDELRGVFFLFPDRKKEISSRVGNVM